MLNKIKVLAQEFIDAIKLSDETYGSGDRSFEETIAMDNLKQALKEYEEKQKDETLNYYLRSKTGG
jgi:3-hydroxy-3-methylglutaryl CoA synthase